MRVLVLLAFAAVATASPVQIDNDFRVFTKSLDLVDDVSVYDEIWDNQEKYVGYDEEGVQQFILNGTNAVLGQFPFVARVTITRRNPTTGALSSGLCSGSYVTNRYLLTSAHCVDSNPTWITTIASMVGNVNRTIPGGTTMQMEQFWFYIKLRTLVGDLAIVRANANLPEGNSAIGFIRMPHRGQTANRFDGPVRLIGWGRDNSGASAVVLQHAEFVAVPLSQCPSSFDAFYEMCYIDPQRWRMSQPGDSGGPVVIEEGGTLTQIGIHAGRRTSGGVSFHSAARIVSFIGWIERNTSVRFRDN